MPATRRLISRGRSGSAATAAGGGGRRAVAASVTGPSGGVAAPGVAGAAADVGRAALAVPKPPHWAAVGQQRGRGYERGAGGVRAGEPRAERATAPGTGVACGRRFGCTETAGELCAARADVGLRERASGKASATVTMTGWLGKGLRPSPSSLPR
eukprot:24722-Chlamydomonas_euryale.AAC.7